ncbi:hypothetical protein L226DRAFT_129126 [Lentinus tigrinus ALCF2SS1-7]|uniref:uncharacterized protein n=1 Tax=Lentinus tigrinus ALCF2SS1-7 TaxID=1328758 RepID=UPI001165DD16|nr:hypothetical protein L226DRAFT_129126 [Lentinus tigrinus ALCF2SS1-7]
MYISHGARLAESALMSKYGYCTRWRWPSRMSSNSADQPNTSAAREPEGHSSWFHRPLTIKDGLILLPLASIPYFLIVKRFHALNMELTQLRRASLDFANELRKTRDTTSRPPDVVVSGQSSPSVATSYPLLPPESMESLRSQLVNLHDLAWKVQKTGSVVIKQNDRIMLSQRNIMQSQRNAKVALTSWETQARIWRDKTSRHILGLYKLKGERCVCIGAMVGREVVERSAGGQQCGGGET